MTKFLPYQQYDVEAIEQWLNKQSLNGYRLTKMDGVFPQFKKYIDHQLYYRVRYCPTAPISGYTHYWGKLYIYEAYSKADLPAPGYARDAMEAAARQQKPFFLLALLVALIATLQFLFTAAPALPVLVWGIAAVVFECLWAGAIAANYLRSRAIAKGADTPPRPWVNLLLTASCVLAIAANCVLVLLAEGVL